MIPLHDIPNEIASLIFWNTIGVACDAWCDSPRSDTQHHRCASRRFFGLSEQYRDMNLGGVYYCECRCQRYQELEHHHFIPQSEAPTRTCVPCTNGTHPVWRG